MKKILMIFLVLIMVFGFSSICFAATTNSSITITDEQNAAAFVYPDTEGTPLGVAGSTTKSGLSSSLTVADESTPQALPKTGGIPEEAFYAVGALLIISAIILSMKKTKITSK